MSVLQTVQKNNRQFTYGQTVQKKNNNRQFTYGQTVQKKTTDNLHMDRQCKKNCTGAFTVLQTVQKKHNNSNLHMDRQCKKNNSNLHMDRQCKKATAIYIWTDSAKKQQQFTYGQYIFTDCTEDNVQNTHTYTQYTVYYKDILNYQRHIIHRMGTSALCTVSIHNVVYA